MPHPPQAALHPTPSGYAGLGPQQVLDSLACAGLHGDGRILQLNSYENRVFQVYLEDAATVVAKFYRPQRWSDAQILEEHAFATELAEAEVPVIAPLTLHVPQPAPGLRLLPSAASGSLMCVPDLGVEHRLSVSPCAHGRAPELEDENTLRWLGRFLGRLHAVGARQPFLHRRVMHAQRDGLQARALLLAGDFVTPAEQPAWLAACDTALSWVERRFKQAGTPHHMRLHGDCHPGNVLWRPEGPHVVDLDDACMGPAVQDLWMLVSGDASTMARQLSVLLEGYRQFMDFDPRELALIEPLRTLRMLRHSAWLAERLTDPAVSQAFAWFGTAAYWSQQTTQMREQIEAMSAAPIALAF